jgi:membrane-bound lytic murein transglycosylase F
MLLAFVSCTPEDGDNAQAQNDENAVVFVTLNSPNTYYVNSDKEFAGLEHDLAKAFVSYINAHKESARESDKHAKFIIADSIEHAISTILNKKADIAAADLTVTEARKNFIDYSSPYQDVQQQVIYNKKITRKPAKKVSELVGKEIVVPAASSFVERLKIKKRKNLN